MAGPKIGMAPASLRSPKSRLRLRSPGPALPPCLQEFRRARLLAQRSRPHSAAATASSAASQQPMIDAVVGDGGNRRTAILSAPPAGAPASEPSAGSTASPRKTMAANAPPAEAPPLLGRSGPLWRRRDEGPKQFESVAELLVALVAPDGKNDADALGLSPGDTMPAGFLSAPCPQDPAHEAGAKLPSVALVVDCLDAVLMKGGADSHSHASDEQLDFLARTLHAVADSTMSQLQATHARRKHLLVEAEELRIQFKRKEHEFQDVHEKISKTLYRPKKEAFEAEAALEKVEDEVESLQERVKDDTSRCEELRQEVTAALDRAREQWASERADLVAERDQRREQDSDLSVHLEVVEKEVQVLRSEAAKQRHESDLAERNAKLLPDAQETLKTVEEKTQRLGDVVRDARLKQAAKKQSKK